MQKGIVGTAMVTALLVGCSIGIKPGSSKTLTANFTVPTTYQEAYRRADTYARQCRTSASAFKGSFAVTGNMYSDNSSAVVHIAMPSTGVDLERIDMVQHGAATAVTITVWGVGIWDEREMAAAQHSIQSGEVTCR